MNIKFAALLFSFLLGVLTCRCSAEDFGLSQKTFDVEHLHTVFTFRKGVLIHEITVFSDPRIKKRWVERFYADSQPVFIRMGSTHLLSEYYTGVAGVRVLQGSRDDKSYPQRLSVGAESFDMGEDGFYHVIADPQSVLRESVIMGAEFSTRALDEARKKHLPQAKSSE